MENYIVDNTIDKFKHVIEIVLQRGIFKHVCTIVHTGSGYYGVYELVDPYQLWEELLGIYQEDKENETLCLKLWNKDATDYLLVELYDEDELAELIVSMRIVSCEKIED